MNHNVVGLAEIMEKATTGDHVKKGTKMNQLMIWIRAWIELADAIVCICTFAIVTPYWSFRLLAWDSKRRVAHKEHKEEPCKKP